VRLLLSLVHCLHEQCMYNLKIQEKKPTSTLWNLLNKEVSYWFLTAWLSEVIILVTYPLALLKTG